MSLTMVRLVMAPSFRSESGVGELIINEATCDLDGFVFVRNGEHGCVYSVTSMAVSSFLLSLRTEIDGLFQTM